MPGDTHQPLERPPAGSTADAGLGASPRTTRLLQTGSTAVVLTVTGSAVLAVGFGSTWRQPVALTLVAVQATALLRVVRWPAAVLAVTIVTGAALWSLFPAISLTGALLAAQIALCVLACVREPRVSRWGVLAMLTPIPLALPAGGYLNVLTYGLAVALAWTAGNYRRTRMEHAAAETRRAVAEERGRIAREIHDVLAHTVSVMVIQAGAAEDGFETRPEQARQALRAIDTAGRSALSELRLLLQSFHADTDTEREPLPGLARLSELADSVRGAGLSVVVEEEGTRPELARAVDLACYRIVQEALTNTLRHAGASRVRVSVAYGPTSVRLTVTDDGGRAGHPARNSVTGSGHGIMGMRERVSLLGGSLRAGPAADGGFEVHAELPNGYVS